MVVVGCLEGDASEILSGVATGGFQLGVYLDIGGWHLGMDVLGDLFTLLLQDCQWS